MSEASPAGERLTQRAEPLTWDIYLIFLLRLLHNMYGGDDSIVFAALSPAQAMDAVTDQYTNGNTPPQTPQEQESALATILDCALYIEAGPHASEPEYLAFLDTLRAMYSDLGGNANDFHHAQHVANPLP